MAVLTFLRGLVVVGRSRQDGVDARARRYFLSFGHCFLRRVGSCAGDDRNASGDDFDGHVDDAQPLVVRESRRFPGRAARNQEIDPGFHLPGDEIPQSGFIYSAVLGERRDESGTAAS